MAPDGPVNHDGADLHSANFQNADLRDATFRGANLSGAVLDGANVCGADLSGADLRGARLRKASAYGAKFVDAQLAGADLADAQLSYATLTGANFSHANLAGAQFEESTCSRACFDGATLANAFIYGGSFDGATFRGADLAEARIFRTELKGADFTNASLLGARLSEIEVGEILFRNTRLPNGEIYPPPEISDENLETSLAAAAADLLTTMAAAVAMLRHKRHGRRADRAEATRLWRGVRESPGFRDHPVLARLVPSRVEKLGDPEIVQRIAWALLAHSDASGDPKVAGELLQQLEQIVDLMPADLTGRAGVAGTLAVCRQRESSRSGDDAAAAAAVDELQQVVEVLSRDSMEFPLLADRLSSWLETRYRTKVGRADDLKRAIALRREALARLDESSSIRASVLLGLGRSLGRLSQETAAQGELREAIQFLEDAARTAADADPSLLPDSSNAVGDAYLLRYSTTGALPDLERAVRSFTEACAAVPEGDARRPGFLANLAAGLRRRFRHTTDRGDLEAAIEAIQEALDATGDSDTERRAGLLQNFGNILADRFRTYGDLSDLDRAIDAVGEAASSGDGGERATRLSNLGSYLQARHARTHNADDLSRAIEVTEAALKSAGPGDAAYLDGRINLAVCLVSRFERAGIMEDLTRATEMLREVHASQAPTAAERSTVVVNLLTCLLAAYGITRDGADLDECVALAEEAVASVTGHRLNLPGILVLQGRARAARSEVTGNAEDERIAAGAFREAARTGLELVPETTAIAAREWSHWAARRGAWSDAAEALQYGLAAADTLYRAQRVTEDREARLLDLGALPADAAYAMAKAGDFEGAVLALEQNRAIQLSASLERDRVLSDLRAQGHSALAADYLRAAGRLHELDVEPVAGEVRDADRHWGTALSARAEFDAAVERVRKVPGFERFGRGPAFSDVAKAASHATVIYLCATAWGGLALVVDRGGDAHPVWLPDLREAEVSSQLSLLAAAPQPDAAGPGFVAALDGLTEWLWTAAMSPLMRRLRSQREIVLIPVGRLGLLPFHAAWRADGDTTDHRRYVIDDLLVRYAPNARVLERARELAAARVLGDALVVEEPRPVSAEPLRFARAEAAAVVQAFAPGVDHLRREQATRSAVLQHIARRSLLHFACHTTAVPNHPLDGGLLTAGDTVVSVRDLLDARLIARLVVLSACDTARPDDRLADERAALPGSLLQAGAAGVIGSLWMVHDESTANLMTRFYQSLHSAGASPAAAFRRAQLEMAHSWPPYYWAGFLYAGA